MAHGLTDENLLMLELMSRSELAVGVKDVDGRYIYLNAAFAALSGRSVDTVLGLTDAEIFESAELLSLNTADQAARLHTGVLMSEQRLAHASGRREFSVARAVLPSSTASGVLVCVWRDPTEARQLSRSLAQALKQLEQQQQLMNAFSAEGLDAVVADSSADSSADLYQRTQFEEQLRREVDLSSREHREFALVSIVVDPLSDAVRAQGDVAQTRVLEALSRLLRSNTRAMDASCRLDQDRFAVLLSGVGLATAHARMEGLRRACATQIVALNGQALGFSVSMGVASFPHTARSEPELVQASELALIEAQRRGGNHVTLATIRFESK